MAFADSFLSRKTINGMADAARKSALERRIELMEAHKAKSGTFGNGWDHPLSEVRNLHQHEGELSGKQGAYNAALLNGGDVAGTRKKLLAAVRSTPGVIEWNKTLAQKATGMGM